MTNTQTLKFTKTKEMAFSVVFTAFAVSMPMLIHYFAGVDGGKTFLPMPFFVLAAGLILGWRAGLATALMSPAVSYLITGMPMANILPFIILQLLTLGVVAGIAKEKYNTLISIVLAITTGWLVMGISLFLFSDINALNYIIQALKVGYFGIAIQLLIIPIVSFYLNTNRRG